MIVGIYPAGEGTEKVKKHEAGQEQMTPSQIFTARRNECILAIGQVSMGTTIGITLITAATEVESGDDDDEDTLVIGLATAVAGALVFVFAYILNNPFYSFCQKPKVDQASPEPEPKSVGKPADVLDQDSDKVVQC
jgi:hypothetical protein